MRRRRDRTEKLRQARRLRVECAHARDRAFSFARDLDASSSYYVECSTTSEAASTKSKTAAESSGRVAVWRQARGSCGRGNGS